ncbi:hypothetical protein QYF36_016367 [Acer negundo]|nr:hypothetical protein QYF36_016367 [Acer negundo]
MVNGCSLAEVVKERASRKLGSLATIVSGFNPSIFINSLARAQQLAPSCIFPRWKRCDTEAGKCQEIDEEPENNFFPSLKVGNGKVDKTPAEKIIQGTSMTLGQVEAFFKDKVQDSPNGRNVDMSNDEVSKHKVAEPAPTVDSISNGTSEAAVQASGNGLEVKVALSNQDTLIDVEEHDRSIKSGGRKKNHSVKTWYDNETFEGVSSYP